MARRERVIGREADLADGCGVRFTVRAAGGEAPAFAIRHRGVVHAYLNVCAHQQVQLDWVPGAFFSADGQTLVCSMHGAHYERGTGKCVAGPCAGAALDRVPVRVRADGAIVVDEPFEPERERHG